MEIKPYGTIMMLSLALPITVFAVSNELQIGFGLIMVAVLWNLLKTIHFNPVFLLRNGNILEKIRLVSLLLVSVGVVSFILTKFAPVPALLSFEWINYILVAGIAAAVVEMGR